MTSLHWRLEGSLPASTLLTPLGGCVPASTEDGELRKAAEAFRQAEGGGVSGGVDKKESKAVVREEKGYARMEGNGSLFYLDEEGIV
ncbi:PREDICTED: dehydration-responsive element-binding 1A [Prunus dulcis]|uniref:PREDICTED: dehydration-responsive element-binding 1A n=1 Tax=Prunus dulcis TaxID=3755 RepID=A0A5E4FV94_PRUDU|nr:hypothetical protein L3X38_028189 [Prunus dulcis]VVA31394.1 PREDICTED: dehydration-responsive element-binding 1A [Prunus dulcis]